MPRPKTKEALLDLSKINFDKLCLLVDQYEEQGIAENIFPEGTLNRNIRDVLCHLHEWHKMMQSWYSVGMNGSKPKMPAEGYTWKTLPALNKKIHDEYKEVDLKTARKLLETSYSEVRHIIQSHTDEELFEKKRYGWTGSTSLGAYLISNTSSHYDWATKLIKRCTAIRE